MEVVIGDDCSTDNTLELIKKYSDKFDDINILDTPKNLGMVQNLKRCFEACRLLSYSMLRLRYSTMNCITACVSQSLVSRGLFVEESE